MFYGEAAVAEQDQNDEQSAFNVVDKIIHSLLPLDPYGRLKVYRTVGVFFGFEDSFPKIDRMVDNRFSENISREPEFLGSEEPTPKEFLLRKQPKTNVERVACLAYYLNHYRNTPEFKTIDISKLNTEAAQTKLTNASYAVNDAVKTGYLAAASKGMRQLSAQGELYVKALPNRDAAKTVKPKKPQRSGRRSLVNRTRSNRDHNKQTKSND